MDVWIIILIIWRICGIIAVVGNFIISYYEENGITIKSLMANFPLFVLGPIALCIELYCVYHFYGNTFIFKKERNYKFNSFERMISTFLISQ